MQLILLYNYIIHLRNNNKKIKENTEMNETEFLNALKTIPDDELQYKISRVEDKLISKEPLDNIEDLLGALLLMKKELAQRKK